MANRTESLWPLYAARIWKSGSSIVFPLYTAILNALGAKPGDLLLIRVHLPYVTFRVLTPDLTLPIPRFSPEELPPGWRDLLREIAERIA